MLYPIHREIIDIQIQRVRSMFAVYDGSVFSLFMMIPKNARITTLANIISYFLNKLRIAKIVATRITIIVHVISLIQKPFRHIFTSNVDIFAIVATEIRQRYKLKGIWKNILSIVLPIFFPICTFWAIMIRMTRNSSMITTETSSCL